MLRLKKTSTKKLVIYFVIVGLMVSGTAFLLYQNYLLTYKMAPMVNIPAKSSDLSKELEASQVDIKGPAIKEATTTKLANLPETNQPGFKLEGFLLDVDVLSSQKFQSLKENIIIQAEKEIGKRNPFER